jgi:hypothetical protein
METWYLVGSRSDDARAEPGVYSEARERSIPRLHRRTSYQAVGPAGGSRPRTANARHPQAPPVGLQNPDASHAAMRLYSLVLMNEPAEDVSPSDSRASHSLGRGSGIGRTKVDAPVRPGPL